MRSIGASCNEDSDMSDTRFCKLSDVVRYSDVNNRTPIGKARPLMLRVLTGLSTNQNGPFPRLKWTRYDREIKTLIFYMEDYQTTEWIKFKNQNISIACISEAMNRKLKECRSGGYTRTVTAGQRILKARIHIVSLQKIRRHFTWLNQWLVLLGILNVQCRSTQFRSNYKDVEITTTVLNQPAIPNLHIISIYRSKRKEKMSNFIETIDA